MHMHAAEFRAADQKITMKLRNLSVGRRKHPAGSRAAHFGSVAICNIADQFQYLATTGGAATSPNL